MDSVVAPRTRRGTRVLLTAVLAGLCGCGAGVDAESPSACVPVQDADAQYRQAMALAADGAQGEHAVEVIALLACAAGGGHAAAQWAYGTAIVEQAADADTRARGMEWQRRAAAQEHLPALLQEGMRAFDAGDATAALEWFRRAAATGDVDAQHALGLMLRDGELGATDPVEAVQWFRAAAEQGHAGAQGALAHAYLDGTGVPRDVHAAQFWLMVQGEAAGDSDRRVREAMAGATDADRFALLKLRAAAWQPGQPGMPYASGSLAYPPPRDPGALPPPVEVWTLTDAAASATPDGWMLLLSPYPIDRPPDPSEWGFPTGLMVTLDRDGAPVALLLHRYRGYVELDPAHFQLDVRTGDAVLRGTITTAGGTSIESARADINTRFAVPVDWLVLSAPGTDLR